MLKPDTWALTILLACLTALGPLSTDMYLPALPAILRDLDTVHASVQLTLSVFLVGFAVGQIFYGPLADRLGRKPVLMTGLAIYAGACLACTLAPTVEVLIGARFLQAFGAAGPVVLARAIVRDLYDRRFYGAPEEAGFAEGASSFDTPQTRHPAYKLAFSDEEFLLKRVLINTIGPDTKEFSGIDGRPLGVDDIDMSLRKLLG